MVTVLSVTQTCGMCPSQWDAWTDTGEYLYIRYRWGVLTVSRGEISNFVYSQAVGDPYDGFMEWARVLELTGIVDES